MNTRNRNRLVLVLIFVMFLVPVLAAVLLQPERFGRDPVDTVNRGALVQPPVPLALEPVRLVDGTPAAGRFEGRWLLLHLLPSPCDDTCRQTITDLRQIHIGTGRHREDVALLLVGDADNASMAADIYDQLHLADTGQAGFVASMTTAALASGTPNDAALAALAGTTFIADPEGNLMLRYAPGYDRGDLNKDLKKLLKWSGR